jgi:hypothetical protein
MAKSKASTPAAYLATLPVERRAVIAKVRQVIRSNLPAGYRETMHWGMICYVVPLEHYPDTYHDQPLCYLALAAQKHYCAIYLTCVYGDPAQLRRLQAGFREAGKKLDMGKSCIRFRRLEDLALDVIGDVVASTPVERFIARGEAARRRRGNPSLGRRLDTGRMPAPATYAVTFTCSSDSSTRSPTCLVERPESEPSEGIFFERRSPATAFSMRWAARASPR